MVEPSGGGARRMGRPQMVMPSGRGNPGGRDRWQLTSSSSPISASAAAAQEDTDKAGAPPPPPRAPESSYTIAASPSSRSRRGFVEVPRPQPFNAPSPRPVDASIPPSSVADSVVHGVLPLDAAVATAEADGERRWLGEDDHAVTEHLQPSGRRARRSSAECGDGNGSQLEEWHTRHPGCGIHPC
ncbi:hypothetical protein E2562_027969 [Oryza meyeriana var. granulata]|uniref:Uncharacterized protein n=1 Tax=Oryza meyeriana var. granulata TaxID=110450 RepID=A0A6G1CTY2_9ORYZ|nr:hypothetical protein E2562_027969 [Oryza meyeriana var. granulata]